MIEDIYEDSYSKSYNLEEFRFSPVGLIPYTIYNSQFTSLPPIEIYSSKNIEKRVLERVKESKITSDIYDVIERGLNNRKLIVGYTNPSKFKFVYQKIKQLAGLKRDWGLGFYDKLDDVTYIILDDNINIFGNTKFDLPLIIAHELCHMATFQNKNTKIIEATMKSTLLPFFSNALAFIMIYDRTYTSKEYNDIINKNKNILEKYLLNISKSVEMTKDINTVPTIYNIAGIWSDFLLECFPIFKNDKNLVSAYGKLLVSLYLVQFYGIKQYNEEAWQLMHRSIKYAYTKIGVLTNNQMLGQEFFYISEVLAISNENGFSSEVLKSIQKLDMGK